MRKDTIPTLSVGSQEKVIQTENKLRTTINNLTAEVSILESKIANISNNNDSHLVTVHKNNTNASQLALKLGEMESLPVLHHGLGLNDNFRGERKQLIPHMKNVIPANDVSDHLGMLESESQERFSIPQAHLPTASDQNSQTAIFLHNINVPKLDNSVPTTMKQIPTDISQNAVTSNPHMDSSYGKLIERFRNQRLLNIEAALDTEENAAGRLHGNQIPTEHQPSIAGHLDKILPTLEISKQVNRNSSLEDFEMPKVSLTRIKPQLFIHVAKNNPELPSATDLQNLHGIKKSAVAVSVKNASLINNPAGRKVNVSQPERKQLGKISGIGKVGDIGDSVTKSFVSEQTENNNIGNLGDAVTKSFVSEDSPEIPTPSDLEEIAQYNKEVAAALKGLGPDATMFKKSAVPKPLIEKLRRKMQHKDYVPDSPGKIICFKVAVSLLRQR